MLEITPFLCYSLSINPDRKILKMAMTAKQINNRAMLNKIKIDNGCETCGYNTNQAALQFDHIDPNTKLISATGRRVNPGAMLSYSQSMILSEIAKCRILCANCHAIHSVEQAVEMRKLGLIKSGRKPKMSEGSVRLVA
jgi:hypothetical protein